MIKPVEKKGNDFHKNEAIYWLGYLWGKERGGHWERVERGYFLTCKMVTAVFFKIIKLSIYVLYPFLCVIIHNKKVK